MRHAQCHLEFPAYIREKSNEWNEFQFFFRSFPHISLQTLCDERRLMRVSLNMMDARFSLNALNTFCVYPSCEPANTEKSADCSHISSSTSIRLFYWMKNIFSVIQLVRARERAKKIFTTFENKKLDIFIFKYIIRRKKSKRHTARWVVYDMREKSLVYVGCSPGRVRDKLGSHVLFMRRILCLQVKSSKLCN